MRYYKISKVRHGLVPDNLPSSLLMVFGLYMLSTSLFVAGNFKGVGAHQSDIW